MTKDPKNNHQTTQIQRYLEDFQPDRVQEAPSWAKKDEIPGEVRAGITKHQNSLHWADDFSNIFFGFFDSIHETDSVTDKNKELA